MNRTFLALTLVGALGLVACASGPQAPAPTAKNDHSNEASGAVVAPPLTGSRLVKRNTDRSVRSVDSQTFKQETEIRGRGNDLGLN